MAEQETPSFSIEKLYVKDLSLEVPNAPTIFLEQTAPEITLQLQTGTLKVGDDIFEVALTATVSAKIGEKSVFLIEAVQAGLFRIRHVPEESMDPLLSIACPNILFPYAREIISESTSRAGFPPVILQPVNFEAMYASRVEERNKTANA